MQAIKKFSIGNLAIYAIKHGVLRTNTYIIFSEDPKKALMIDPGESSNVIVDFLKNRDLNSIWVIGTHGHFDHVCGVDEIKSAYNAKFFMSSEDLFLKEHNKKVLKRFNLNEKDCPLDPDIDLKDLEKIEFDDQEIEVLKTPGHTPGSILLYLREVDLAFSGDTIFAGSIGRTDFFGGNEEEMKKSIKLIHERVNADALVLPGHGIEFRLAKYIDFFNSIIQS
ncbi:MBL fold metallo-hydrolase [Fervidicoccus sp.]|uniref:MBL fold metallo-hydrolase n=1 Tax=Fervidicoccus sp. TaxID=2060324 RepID=UPI003D0D85EF